MEAIFPPGREPQVLTGPCGIDDPDIYPLPVTVTHDGQVCESFWELSPAEREAIADGALVKLSVWSGATQPPVRVDVIRAEGAKERA